MDFAQIRGTPFRASGPGVVSSIDYSPRAGHTVWVRYDNGPNVGYCHMDYRTSNVRVGQRVSEGTILGLVGSLGLASTGPHLHVEVAGHATTAGFWKFFDRNRVVGQGSTAGGETTPGEWDEMASEAQLEAAFRRVLNENGSAAPQLNQNVKFLADQANGWVAKDRPVDGQLATAIGRIDEILFAVDGRADPRVVDANGDPVMRKLASFLNRPFAISDTQIKAIADAVAAQIGQSDATIDYGKVADSVRDRFRTDPLK